MTFTDDDPVIMNPTVEMFLDHAKAPVPGFGCFASNDRDETVAFYAPVQNLLQEGAYPDTLKQFSKWIEDPEDQIREFFGVIDGALLYVDSQRNTQGLHLCSLSEWKLHTNKMRKRYVRDLEEFTGDTRFLTDSHVIACVPNSGKNPAQFLRDIGSYARYSDCETDTQWIPKEYIPDLTHRPITLQRTRAANYGVF